MAAIKTLLTKGLVISGSVILLLYAISTNVTTNTNTNTNVNHLDRILSNLSDIQRHLATVAKDDVTIQPRPRILIWVMTGPQNLNKRTEYVKKTWARRADRVLYFSSVTNPSFPTIGLNVSEGRQHLLAKTMQAFRYVYQHHFHDADWFMKADDDTYVIMENLRHFLSDKDASDPMYYGQLFKKHVRQGFHGGGAGYVLSRAALRKLATLGGKCKQDSATEDVDMGRCMQAIGVKTGTSLDSFGKTRFHSFEPEVVLQGNYHAWFKEWDANGGKWGKDSVSHYPITFHYVSGVQMEVVDFLIYHVMLQGRDREVVT